MREWSKNRILKKDEKSRSRWLIHGTKWTKRESMNKFESLFTSLDRPVGWTDLWNLHFLPFPKLIPKKRTISLSSSNSDRLAFVLAWSFFLVFSLLVFFFFQIVGPLFLPRTSISLGCPLFASQYSLNLSNSRQIWFILALLALNYSNFRIRTGKTPSTQSCQYSLNRRTVSLLHY